MAKSKTAFTLGESVNIPLNNLKLSDDNVRKIYDKAAINDMAADIRTNGLIQSLSVRPLAEPEGDVTHEVQGGGRRFRALQLLVKQKTLAPDASIPCVPNERHIAAQISLAENVQRINLQPLDEFRAFAAMQVQGKTEDDIAAAFRVSPAVVKQRLRLGNASPVLHKAFEDEKIGLKDLMAFCVTDNHERQEQVWNQVKKQTYLNTFTIKQMLTESTVPANDKRARFIGLDVYLKAGGVVIPDLFEEQHAGYLQDVDLLNQLVKAKLDKAREDMTAKGWKWATAAVSIPYSETNGYDQLSADNEDLTDEQQEQLEALEAERDQLTAVDDDQLTKKQRKRLETVKADIDALENPEPEFSAEDMARAGVTIEISHDGSLIVEYGFIKPEDEETDDTAAGGIDGVNSSANGNPSTEEDDGDANKPLSESLVTDLTEFRTLSLQAALAANPKVAYLAVLHAVTLQALYHYGTSSCLQINTSTGFPSNAEGLKDYAPTKAMSDQRKAWTARLPKNSSELWGAIDALSAREQAELLAFVAALSINVVVQKHDKRSAQVQHSQVLADALGFDIRKDWKPTADNYFGRVTKAQIISAVTESKDEHTADLMSHMKKDGMAREAERIIGGLGWLPEPLRAVTAKAGAEDDVDDGDEADLPDFLNSDDAGGDADEDTVANA